MLKVKALATLIVLSMLGTSLQGQKDADKRSGLDLAIGFRLGLLMDPQLEASLEMTRQKILQYGVREVRIYGGGNAIAYKYLNIEGFSKIEQGGSLEEKAKYERQLQWFKDHGIRITLSGGEPSLPATDYYSDDKNSFFNLYPEARYLENGLLWKFYEERTYALFKTFPQVDATDYFLWETPILDDLNYFPGIKWQKPLTWHKGENQYYSQADYLTEFMAAVIRGANRAKKDFSILTFSHYPYQEKLLLESLKELERRNESFLMVHKSQSGDWDPYKGPNRIMMETNTRASLLFDGVGEYWGRSFIPYCFPEEIQVRVQHALNHNRAIRTLAMRTYWEKDQTLFENYNEVNLYALSRFAKDPYVDVRKVWDDWAMDKFGKEAAPTMVRALKRTDDIANSVYYFKGVWVQEHSKMASLDYMTAQVLHTGKSMIKWNPDDIKNNALIEAFVYHPTEEIIKMALNEREEALALCRESISDIESVKKILSKKEYQKVKGQFLLMEDFVKLSMPHIEAYLRYIINRDRPTRQNRNALSQSLRKLEDLAVQMDKKYGATNYLISSDAILKFVADIEERIEPVHN
ncbi:hypothetical protein SAMN05421766_10937 [Zobellia uliginosa]|uniref:Glycosyl hydrolase family 20, domain 2 n=1 Tax=Zobellia uliginosa TaxID=143224 RepID=A0ABY1L1A2_9FLAO|nr:hypothetical protein [Zobellia uliginosa]SIT08481.1 hypothetical protein SAMN05421766_10937 [Zobellia uliginosa]